MRNLSAASVDAYVEDLFPDAEIPDILAESLERHRQNLLRMIENLRSAGLSDDQIEMSVTILVESYRLELVAALKTVLR